MPEVSDLLRYIEGKSPGVLASLRQKFPNEAELLTPKLMLGPGDAAAEESPALIDVLTIAAKELRDDLRRLVDYIVGRLRLGTKIRTGGAVVSTFTGLAAAWLAFVDAADRAVALSSAMFAALGGIASLGAGLLEKSPSGMRVSLAQDLTSLTTYYSEVDQINRVLERRDVRPVDAAQCEQMLARLDVVRQEVERLRPR